MNKRGQFYLIAAIAIIALIIGLVLIGNSSSSQKSNRVDVVASELSIESAKFFDRAAISSNYNWNEFTANFSDYESDVNIVYITGTLSSYEVYKYDNGVKNTTITNSLNSGILTITYDGSDYNFKMREGQNFYYILTQYVSGAKYVKRN